jgi:outer membrane lipoprotein SlyB
MSENRLTAHPLMVIAATTVILTCALAIGIMTGVIPSPLAKDRAAQENAAATTRQPSSVKAPASTARERTAERPPVGSTSSSASGGAVAGSGPKVAAVCTNCGTVTSVRTLKQQGEAGLIGPIAGGAIGGVVGSQIGGGSGKTLATIVGAAGGAAVGTEVERRQKAITHYVVGVRMTDGSTRNFTYSVSPGVREGDKVRVVDDRLIHDS